MTKNKIIYQVDSFTEIPFKGNPAGVMILEKEETLDFMQNIAMEMNLSETAFVIKQNDSFRIRYFTPTIEVPLCGHATLASAHIIYEIGLVQKSDKIKFIANAGDLEIRHDDNWIVMNFPRYSLSKTDIPVEFKQVMGFDPIECYKSDYDWLIAIANSQDEILQSRPKFELMKSTGLGHLMITSESIDTDVDFVVRCFAPISGINEDPVTGSAHCALTPLWNDLTGKTEFNSFQLSKRTGKLTVKLLGDKVEIKGKAITIFKAELNLQ